LARAIRDEKYGIGGATALIYYFEPIQTQDIDVFVVIDAALNDCIEASYADTRVRIFSLEYLMAIMIQTGRGKDKARLEEILKVKLAFNQDKLQSILY
jgi:hypothetical protein